MSKSRFVIVAVGILAISGYFGYTATVFAKGTTKSVGLINLKINPTSTQVKSGKKPQKTNAREIKSISGSTFTIEVDKVSYKVSTHANTTIINSKGKKISFSDLKIGHLVRVIGIFKPSNTDAQWIQDTSI